MAMQPQQQMMPPQMQPGQGGMGGPGMGGPGPGQDPMAMLQQNPEMMQMLETMAPEEREAFMMQLFQDYQGQEGIIADQQAKAEALRGAQGPEGVQTGRGGYVAGNPLGHAAAGMQQFMGNQQAQEALQAKKDLSEARTGGVMSMADLLRSGG